MRESKEGKAAINLRYVFGRPTEDRHFMSAHPEVEDSIANANGENVSGSGPNDEHDVSQEGSLDLMQKVAWTILVRDSVGLTLCIENLQSDTPEGPAAITENIAGHGVPSDARV